MIGGGLTPAQQREVAANAAQVAILIDLERRAADAASGFLRRLLSNELRSFATQYTLLFGGLDRPADPALAQPMLDEFARAIDDLRGYDPTPAVQPFVDEAADRGVVWALRGSPSGPATKVVPSHKATQALAEIPDNVSQTIDQTQLLARSTQLTSWDDAVRLVGSASRSVTSVDRSVSIAVVAAMNSPVRQIATADGVRILWVAEPNACVVCLKLSGRLADPATGTWFDETATFGRPGSAPDVWPPGHPLRHPPRHPNCRCVLQTWWGSAGPADLTDFPAALQREAKRSILTGRALPSESAHVRLAATRRLLAAGSGLPRTVEARAQHAVKTGRYSQRIK